MNQIVVVDPETGIERRKFGGAQPGSGRPKKRPIETLEDWAGEDENKKKILEAMVAGLDETLSPGERRRTAMAILEKLRQEEQDQIDERRTLEQSERDALLSGILRRVGASIEGEAEELVDGDILQLDAGGTGSLASGVSELEEG